VKFNWEFNFTGKIPDFLPVHSVRGDVLRNGDGECPYVMEPVKPEDRTHSPATLTRRN
jgi:hypothetical protein